MCASTRLLPTLDSVTDAPSSTHPPGRAAALARVRRLAREPASWGVFLGFWGVVALAWQGLAATAPPDFRTTSLLVATADAASWALLCLCGFLLAAAVPLEPDRPGRACALVLPAGVVLVVARVLAFGEVQVRLGLGRVPLAVQLAIALGAHLLSFLSFVAAGYAILYAIGFRERQLALARSEAEVARARFQALRSRLHPGFLLDAFQGVSVLLRRDVRAADRMLLDLSELLRRTLRNTTVEEIPLRQELDYIGRYLELVRARSGGGPRVSLDATPEALEAPVPPGVLFRVLEAGVRSADGAVSGTVAAVRARVENGVLRLRVRDDVAAGMDARRAHPEWEEVALLGAVLEQRFGPPAGWTFADAAGGGIRGELVLPLAREPAA
jgi:hypothetical protein